MRRPKNQHQESAGAAECISIVMTETQNTYITAASRLRDCSRRELIRRVVDVVLTDQLVLSILDDAEDRPAHKRRRSYRNPFVDVMAKV